MLKRFLAIVLVALLAVPTLAAPHHAPLQVSHGTAVGPVHAGQMQHRHHDRAPDLSNHICIGCAASYGGAIALPMPMLPPIEVPAAPLASPLGSHGLAPETPPPRA